MCPRPTRRPAVALLLLVPLSLNSAARAAAGGDDPLPSWKEGAAKRAITDFVARVTAEGGRDFVAPEDRLAVFDNDGTLWCEQPMYFQVTFALDRVRAMAPRHPEWKGKEPFRSVLAGDTKGVAAAGEKGVMEIVAATHAGMTTGEFNGIVREWVRTARHPRFRRPYAACVYQPMLEVLAYLRINRFIGRRPILCFGNSDGDLQMLQYTTVDGPADAGGGGGGELPRLGLVVHHTDAAREYAYDRKSDVGRLDKVLDEAARRGWVVVDMKDDWKTVFPGRR